MLFSCQSKWYLLGFLFVRLNTIQQDESVSIEVKAAVRCAILFNLCGRTNKLMEEWFIARYQLLLTCVLD